MDPRGPGIDVAAAVGAPPMSVLQTVSLNEAADFELPISVFFPEDFPQRHVKVLFLLAAQPGSPKKLISPRSSSPLMICPLFQWNHMKTYVPHHLPGFPYKMKIQLAAVGYLNNDTFPFFFFFGPFILCLIFSLPYQCFSHLPEKQLAFLILISRSAFGGKLN